MHNSLHGPLLFHVLKLKLGPAASLAAAMAKTKQRQPKETAKTKDSGNKSKVKTPTVRQALRIADKGPWKLYPLPAFNMAHPNRPMLTTEWLRDLTRQVQILFEVVHGQRSIVQAEWERARTVQAECAKLVDTINMRLSKVIAVHNNVVMTLSKVVHLHNHHYATTTKSFDRCKHAKFTPKDMRDILKLQIDPETTSKPQKAATPRRHTSK